MLDYKQKQIIDREFSKLDRINPELKTWWELYEDRHFMANKLFPLIGDYFRDRESKNVLNIGVEWYNIADKELCLNDDIKLYGVDNQKKGTFSIPETWSGMYYRDMFDRNSLHDLPVKFDAIIDYGVLGVWWLFPFKPSKDHFRNYFNNILSSLNDGGLYFIKLDLKTGDDNFSNIGNLTDPSIIEQTKDMIYKYFTRADFYDIGYHRIGESNDTLVLERI
tara:strand:+ start:2172 stop:2834 length:663 start_codon:yes stop_codon:yes gene_type:complete